MTKTCFLYEDMDRGRLLIFMSLMSVADQAGVGYRRLQRLMKGRDRYYEPGGAYRICRVSISQDGRKKNGNRNNLR